MIYTLGPEGTFSDKAAAILARRLGGHKERRFAPNISDVFERALEEEGAMGVVPIENAVAGTVDVVQDLLARQPVWIESELQIPIAFKLLVRGGKERARCVFVHPVAERQCAADIRQAVPGAEVVLTDSNSDSAVRFFSTPSDAAAVVPVDYREPGDPCLEVFALRTAAHNATRFIVFQRAPADPRPDFSQEKLSVLITPRRNRPGLLYDILGTFKRNAMNLTRIVSRPANGPWEYVFFLDATITAGAAQAWTELQQGDWDVRLLGTYSVLRA